MSVNSTSVRPVLRRHGLPALLLLLFIFAGFRLYGLGDGGSMYFRASQNPLQAQPAAEYFRESFLPVVLTHYLGLNTSEVGFRFFLLSFFWAGVYYLLVQLRRRLSAPALCLVAACLLLYPTTMIVHSWSGHPDALTFFFTSLLMFSQSVPVLFFASVFGALNHASMWLLITAQLVTLRALAEPGQRWRISVPALAGTLCGWVGLKYLLWVNGIQINVSRLDFPLQIGLPRLIQFWVGRVPETAYSLYFAHALLLPMMIYVLGPKRRFLSLVFVMTQVGVLAATFVTEDTTRVFTVLSWGSVFYILTVCLTSERLRLAERPKMLWAMGATTLLTLCLPRTFAWLGQIHDLTVSHQHWRQVFHSL